MLAEHVDRLNEAVRSGDYDPMLATFAADADAGRMIFTSRDGEKVRLVVTFE